MCKISVIVPLYNGKKTISRCLDSLINQTLYDIEILVINDGSQDGGETIVEQYMQRDQRIRLISKENAGQGAARNLGLKEAKGQFVGFVDCDDFVDANMYKIMVNALEGTDVSLAICQEKNVYEESGKLEVINDTCFSVKKNTVFFRDEILDWFLNFSYLSLNSACYKVVKKNVFEDYQIKFPENYRYAEDLVASAALFAVVDKVLIIPKSLYYYVHTKKSFSYNYSIKNAIDIYHDWKEVKEYIKESNYHGIIYIFSLGMMFSSLKQLCWSEGKEATGPKAEKLKKIWRREKKRYGWRPKFCGHTIPIAHKIKVCVSYLQLEKAMCVILKKLSWIPFFYYMT